MYADSDLTLYMQATAVGTYCSNHNIFARAANVGMGESKAYTAKQFRETINAESYTAQLLLN